MAIKNDITVYKGEDVVIPFTLARPDDADITAWPIAFTLKANATDPSALLSIAAHIISGPSRTFSITLTAAQMTLPAGIYAYDVQRTDTVGVLSIGKFVILQEVRTA